MGEQIAVVVAAKNAIFFGYIDEADEFNKDDLKIHSAACCLYWPAAVKGLLGLASSGPTSGCRVGPSVPSIVVHDISAVIRVTPDAVTAWEKKPWA